MNQPDVVVHLKNEGCPICQSRDEHTHTQKEWRAAVDRAGEALMRRMK